MFRVFLVTFLFLIGCDFRENALIREQSDTFQKELQYRQKTEQDLSNKLQVAQNQIAKLEKQILCREKLIEEGIDQAKRDMLKKHPITIE